MASTKTIRRASKGHSVTRSIKATCTNSRAGLANGAISHRSRPQACMRLVLHTLSGYRDRVGRRILLRSRSGYRDREVTTLLCLLLSKRTSQRGQSMSDRSGYRDRSLTKIWEQFPRGICSHTVLPISGVRLAPMRVGRKAAPCRVGGIVPPSSRRFFQAWVLFPTTTLIVLVARFRGGAFRTMR